LTIRNSSLRKRTFNRMNRSQEPLRRAPCTLRVCGRKKLPFAGYSVIKERSAPGSRPRRRRRAARRADAPLDARSPHSRWLGLVARGTLRAACHQPPRHVQRSLGAAAPTCWVER
jgi:hypothetical protein